MNKYSSSMSRRGKKVLRSDEKKPGNKELCFVYLFLFLESVDSVPKDRI